MGTGRDSRHNEKLHDLYCSQNIQEVISRWLIREEHVVCIEEEENAYKALVSKPEGKSALGMTRRRREDNVKMNLI